MDGQATEADLMSQINSGVNVAKRTLYITGEVDSALAHKSIMTLEILDSTDGDIRIVLNSEGGEEQPGYAIHDAIALCRNRVVIEGYGNVMSIAAAIFQAGDLRRMTPNTLFMIHNGTAPSEEQMQQDSIIDLAEQLKKDNRRYYEILSAASQQPVDTVREWCRDETYFSADEAVGAGFADEIIPLLKQKTSNAMPRKRRRKK